MCFFYNLFFLLNSIFSHAIGESIEIPFLWTYVGSSSTGLKGMLVEPHPVRKEPERSTQGRFVWEGCWSRNLQNKEDPDLEVSKEESHIKGVHYKSLKQSCTGHMLDLERGTMSWMKMKAGWRHPLTTLGSMGRWHDSGWVQW